MKSPILRSALALITLCTVLGAVSTASAKPHPVRGIAVHAPDLCETDLAKMRDPVLIDRSALRSELQALEGDMADLASLAAQARNTRMRSALTRQVEGMRVRANRMRRDLRSAERVIIDVHTAPVADVVYEVAPMSKSRFNALTRTLKKTPFYEDRRATLRSVSRSNYFTTKQAHDLVKLFPFGDDRKAVMVTLYPRTVDPENYYTLYTLLPFSDDRRAMMQRIERIDHPLLYEEPVRTVRTGFRHSRR